MIKKSKIYEHSKHFSGKDDVDNLLLTLLSKLILYET